MLGLWLTGILSSHLFGISYNLISDLVEIVKLLSGEMEELSPFIWVVFVHLDFGDAFFDGCLAVGSGFRGRRSVDQLQNLLLGQNASGDSPMVDGSRYPFLGVRSHVRQCSTTSDAV